MSVGNKQFFEDLDRFSRNIKTIIAPRYESEESMCDVLFWVNQIEKRCEKQQGLISVEEQMTGRKD